MFVRIFFDFLSIISSSFYSFLGSTQIIGLKKCDWASVTVRRPPRSWSSSMNHACGNCGGLKMLWCKMLHYLVVYLFTSDPTPFSRLTAVTIFTSLSIHDFDADESFISILLRCCFSLIKSTYSTYWQRWRFFNTVKVPYHQGRCHSASFLLQSCIISSLQETHSSSKTLLV